MPIDSLSPALTVYAVAVTGLLGLCLGSFFTVCVDRIPMGQSIIAPHSHCDRCTHVLGAGDLIPVFSFIALRGRCRYCGERLSRLHPVMELLTAGLYIGALCMYGISARFIIALLFISLLILLAFSDIRHMLLPDRYHIIGALVALMGSLLKLWPLGWLQSVIGGVSVALPLYLFVVIYGLITKRDGMGLGDIKMLAMTGSFLGWKLNLLALLAACIIGSVYGLILKRRSGGRTHLEFPFAPFIALGAVLALFFGNSLIDWYLSLFLFY